MPNDAASDNFLRIDEERTIQEFLQKHPRDTADRVLRWWQIVWYAVVAVAILLLFLKNEIHVPALTIALPYFSLNRGFPDFHLYLARIPEFRLYFAHIIQLFCTFYIVVICLKLVSVAASIFSDNQIRVKPQELEAVTDAELPLYTILVPLFHEKEVASKIVAAIDRLDYPKDKLDVKLLLEPDDEETLAAIRQLNLPGCYQPIIVPRSQPRTKPKACNHGLEHARGEYLVIYDAEDRPEPDQLRKAIAAFRKAAPDTVCLQAKLNYYNPDQNWLTRFFTVEYSTWFDLYLSGLHSLRWPIPLGGTSNHFKTSVLREIGGWDPFNVTEDCDLGIRLHRLGHKTEILDSTTWEEANSQLFNWIRQRSRWVKGYLQTHFVYMRNPFRSLRLLGLWGFCGFLLTVGGLALMLLLNPIFWLIGLTWLTLFGIDLYAAGGSIREVMALPAPLRWSWRMLYNDPTGDPVMNTVSLVFYGMTLALVLGNVVFIAISVLACWRRRMPRLIPYALLSPFYWALISVGAWKGFLQLLTRPFYWEKTKHGLDQAKPF